MNVRSIIAALDPSPTKAARILNAARHRAGIAEELHRPSIYRWIYRGLIPANWLQVCAIVIRETREPATFIDFAIAITENPPNKTTDYKGDTDSSPDRHIDAAAATGV